MRRVLSNFDDVISALGGRQAVGHLTGRGITAIDNWQNLHDGKFPARTLLVIEAALKAKGFGIDRALFSFEIPGARRSSRRRNGAARKRKRKAKSLAA